MKKVNIIKKAVIMIAALAATITVFYYRSKIIINAGITVFRALSIICLAISIISAVVCISMIIRYRAKESARLKKLAAEEAARQEEIRKKKEDVRGLIRDLMNEESGFVPTGTTLLHDMDQIDEYVERNEKLFEFNDMSEFTNMKEIMGSVKSAVYHNCRSIVNLYVALESGDEFSSESQIILDNNKELMNNSKEFLLQMARYTNEQNEDTDAVTMIQGYADAIGMSLKHSYN